MNLEQLSPFDVVHDCLFISRRSCLESTAADGIPVDLSNVLMESISDKPRGLTFLYTFLRLHPPLRHSETFFDAFRTVASAHVWRSSLTSSSRVLVELDFNHLAWGKAPQSMSLKPSHMKAS
jgi:hypothetical protein